MPISLVIAAVIGAAGAAGAAFIAGVAITAGALLIGASVSFGLSLLSQLLAPNPNLSGIGTLDGSLRQTTRAAVLRPRYIMGRARVGGFLVYYHEIENSYFGDLKGRGDRVVDAALVLGAAPMDGIERIWINGEEIQWGIIGSEITYDPSGVFRQEIIDTPIRDGDTIRSDDYSDTKGTLRAFQMWAYLSGSGADAPEMRDASDEFWTNDHNLHGLAWVHLRFWQPDYGNDLDDRVWSGFPQMEFQVKGLRFTWPGQAVAAWTDNAAAIRYWWERNVQGIPASAFDEPSVISAIAVCGETAELVLPIDVAALISFLASVTVSYVERSSKYTVNGVINLDDDTQSAKAELDFAWQGEVIEAAGTLFFRPGVDRPVSGTIDADNIIRAISFQPQKSIQDRTNALSMQLAQSASHAWTKLDLPEFEDAEAQVSDGGKLPASIGTRAYVSDAITAGRLMATLLRRQRASGIYSYRVAPGALFEALLWLPTDRLLLTDPEYGFNQTLVVIDKIKRNDDWSLNVTMHEAPDGIYANDAVLPPLIPRRLDNPPGSLRGQPGQDGQGYEYVFARTATANLPGNQRPDDDWGYDSPVAVSGLLWTDDFVGPTADMPFEWRSRRTVPGTPEAGDDVSASKGDFSDPIIAFRFAEPGQPGFDGIDGADGEDGQPGEDGLAKERIFARTATVNPPGGPSNSWGFDNPVGVWSDAAPNLSDSFPYLWTNQRTIEGAPAFNASILGIWEGSTIVGRFGPEGQPGFDGIEGADGSDGQPGEDGLAKERIFARTATVNPPGGPSNSWGFDNPVGVWSDAAPNLSDSFPYLWTNQRTIEGAPAFNASIPGIWEGSTIVGRFGPEGQPGFDGIEGADGSDGAEGEDGLAKERIFARTAAPNAPTAPLNSRGFDNPSGSWSDGAPNLSDAFPYLWTNQRTIEGAPAFNSTVSANWEGSTIVGRFGPSGVAGVAGIDGIEGADGSDGAEGEDGLAKERIFARTAAPNAPTAPLNSRGFDNPSGSWSDGAPNLSDAFPYLWTNQRTIEGAPAFNASISALWEGSRIVGRFGPSGIDGAEGSDGIDGVEGADGSDGQPGEDGLAKERIFARTATPNAPTAPSNAFRFDNPTGIWSDAAPNLSDSFPYLWTNQRTIEGAPAFNASIPGIWEGSTIVGRFGPAGQRGLRGFEGIEGADGSEGQPGEDGEGVEYIFARSSSSSQVATPSNAFGYDAPTGVWSDGAPNLSSSLRYLWRAERKTIGVPARFSSVSDNWSVPTIVAHFGADGIEGADGSDGAPGEDGLAKERIFARTATPNAPSVPSNLWSFDNPRAPWSDGAPNLSDSFPYLWTNQRTIEGAPGAFMQVSADWEGSRIVGRFGPSGVAGIDGIEGADGSDGAPGEDGLAKERIFARTATPNAPTAPSNIWGFDYSPGGVWFDGAPSLSAAFPYLWTNQRTIVGAPARFTAVSALWEGSTIAGHFGVDGADARDITAYFDEIRFAGWVNASPLRGERVSQSFGTFCTRSFLRTLTGATFTQVTAADGSIRGTATAAYAEFRVSSTCVND